MKKYAAGLSLVALMALTGCANMSTSEQRVLSGAALGAVGGTAIGAISGNAGAGAAIGAAAGAVGGVIYDQHQKSKGEEY